MDQSSVTQTCMYIQCTLHTHHTILTFPMLNTDISVLPWINTIITYLDSSWSELSFKYQHAYSTISYFSWEKNGLGQELSLAHCTQSTPRKDDDSVYYRGTWRVNHYKLKFVKTPMVFKYISWYYLTYIHVCLYREAKIAWGMM